MTVCTVADYREATGDRVSADDDVVAALAKAQGRVEEKLERLLDDGEHTEALPVDDDGRVWPSAFPVLAVTSPTPATIDGDGFSVKVGVGLPAFALVDWEAFPSMSPRSRTTASVTYTGGPWAACPQELKDVICEVAHRRLRPANTAGVPAGATSVSMGGTASQSFSGGALGGSSALTPEILATLQPHMHPHSRRFD